MRQEQIGIRNKPRIDSGGLDHGDSSRSDEKSLQPTHILKVNLTEFIYYLECERSWNQIDTRLLS